MTLLTKQQILSAADLPHEDVAVPEWGGTVRVKAMNGLERDEWRKSLNVEGSTPLGRFSATLLAVTIVDENGQRIFEESDLEAIERKNAKVLDGPTAVAMRLNGLGGASVEDAEKNSEATQNADSGSGSQKN